MQPAGLNPITAAENLRRSIVVACALGVAAIIACSLIGHPLMGIFGTLGLAVGALNNWLLQRSVIAQAASASAPSKSTFRRGVMRRLLGITLIAAAIAALVRPDGFGVFFGLAVFQIVLLFGAAIPVFRSLRPTS